MSTLVSYSKKNIMRDDPGRVDGIVMAAGILVSSILILCAARGDLWLDEIWSIAIAESARTPWEIVSVYKHDNNHVLNTLYLYFLGTQSHLIVYRLLSVLSGILSIAVMATIARKWGRLESILVILFAGISYPLILYFSEARGYSTAMLLALLALYILQEYQRKPTLLKRVLFWLMALFGILSHISFIIIAAALSIYIMYYEVSLRQSFSSGMLNAAKLLSVPFIGISVFYAYFVKNITIGGGDVNSIPAETAWGIAYLTGLPDGLVYLGFPTAIASIAVGVYFFIKQKDAIGVFYLSATFLAPLLLLIITRPAVYYFRYLVVCFLFYYLLMTHAFGKAYKSNKYVKLLLIAVSLLYIIGQTQRIVPFLELGRGNYRKILAEMSERTQGNILTIGSDHDFRNKMLVSFYSRFIKPPKEINYIDRSDWNARAPEWIITHSTDPLYEPLPWLIVSDREQYKLLRSEKFYRNSGLSWFLYHKEGS